MYFNVKRHSNVRVFQIATIILKHFVIFRPMNIHTVWFFKKRPATWETETSLKLQDKNLWKQGLEGPHIFNPSEVDGNLLRCHHESSQWVAKHLDTMQPMQPMQPGIRWRSWRGRLWAKIPRKHILHVLLLHSQGNPKCFQWLKSSKRGGQTSGTSGNGSHLSSPNTTRCKNNGSSF